MHSKLVLLNQIDLVNTLRVCQVKVEEYAKQEHKSKLPEKLKLLVFPEFQSSKKYHNDIILVPVSPTD